MMVRISINGTLVDEANAVLDVRDHALLRGDGCFEAMRSYRGDIFASAEHLDRLEHSAAALRIDLPTRADLEAWVTKAAQDRGDAIIRLVATRGDAADAGLPPQVIVYAEPVPERLVTLRVLTLVAPWHSAGTEWALAGVKSLSYAPNMSASREARERNFDDALLLSRDGVVLEGPTYTVAWVCDGRLETPALDLGILDSITRRHVLAAAAAIGVSVETGRYGLSRLEEADELMALSTVKEVTPITQVDGATIESGPITASLWEAFQLRRDATLARSGG